MFGWFKRSPEEKFAKAVYRLDRGFDYKSERYEKLFSVPMCIARGGGDCDDKADMWYRALKAWGFAPKVVHGSYRGVLHAAVLCWIGQKNFVFCNAEGRLAEADRYLGGNMTGYRILSDADYEMWCKMYRVDRV
jgi:hypothetical protein